MRKYRNNDRVKFINTNTSLDGLTGRIVGVSFSYAEFAQYIVLFDIRRIYDNEEWSAIQITEYCLEKID